MTDVTTESVQEFDGALVLVIDDEATQRLMQDFYSRRVERKTSRIQALREAQLTMLRRNRIEHGEGLPSTWGAFVLEGDCW